MAVLIHYTLPGDEQTHEFYHPAALTRDEALAALFDQFPEATIVSTEDSHYEAPATAGSVTPPVSTALPSEDGHDPLAAMWAATGHGWPRVLRILGALVPVLWLVHAAIALTHFDPPEAVPYLVPAFIGVALLVLTFFVVARVVELLEQIQANTRMDR